VHEQNISIIAVETASQLKEFIQFPYDLYRGEENWVAPLRFERATQIDPKKNPGFEGVEYQLFLAEQNGETVGRIAAINNSHHLKFHNDNAGHFGFFDTQTDPAIGQALMATVEAWLKERGLRRIVGPYQASIYEEVGLLVDGFDTPPVLMMPYGRPDYQKTIEDMGFTKAVDMYAFWANIHEGYPRPKIVTTMTNYIESDPDITVRPMNKSKFLQEVQMAMEIFNDAWSDNWGHVPLSDDQIKHMAAELKPVINKDFFWVCEYKGEPAAFILMVPNVNEAIADLDGKLLPFGWAKLLYRLKVKGVKTARIPLMGVRREFQRKRTGLAMAAFLSEKAFEKGREHGFTHVEMGWILETNKSMIRIIEQAKGVAYKTYRMYEKPIL
jgi:GNAT superfamily N-acetyltransferase